MRASIILCHSQYFTLLPLHGAGLASRTDESQNGWDWELMVWWKAMRVARYGQYDLFYTWPRVSGFNPDCLTAFPPLEFGNSPSVQCANLNSPDCFFFFFFFLRFVFIGRFETSKVCQYTKSKRYLISCKLGILIHHAMRPSNLLSV